MIFLIPLVFVFSVHANETPATKGVNSQRAVSKKPQALRRAEKAKSAKKGTGVVFGPTAESVASDPSSDPSVDPASPTSDPTLDPLASPTPDPSLTPITTSVPTGANPNQVGPAIVPGAVAAPAAAPIVPPPPSNAGGGGMNPMSSMMPMMGQMGQSPQSSNNGRGRRSSALPAACFNNSSVCQCHGASKIADAIKEAQEFHQLCTSQGVLNSSGNRLMAINDYREKVGCMYLVNVDTGQCEFATTSDYGRGSGVPPRPGCESNSRMTPAGFHVTRPHNGARYDTGNSLGMAGLQGQNSAGRGILIHQGYCRGGASTWGCAGVGDYKGVRERLGSQGSLIYNYFGDEVGNCSGARDRSSCKRDDGRGGGGEGDYSPSPNSGAERDAAQ